VGLVGEEEMDGWMDGWKEGKGYLGGIQFGNGPSERASGGRAGLCGLSRCCLSRGRRGGLVLGLSWCVLWWWGVADVVQRLSSSLGFWRPCSSSFLFFFPCWAVDSFSIVCRVWNANGRLRHSVSRDVGRVVGAVRCGIGIIR
jgi:hypothetical protein